MPANFHRVQSIRQFSALIDGFPFAVSLPVSFISFATSYLFTLAFLVEPDNP